MGYLDKDGLSRAFTKLKTLIDKKQDKMKQIGLPSSTATYKNKWIKFATIDLSSSNAWYVCSGTLSFTQGEGGNALGTLKFYCRNGVTAGVIGSSSLTWVSLSDNSYAGSVAYVKAANGKYDMYYKPLKDYETPWIALVDCTAYNLFTFSTNSYVASITASNTSFVASHASSASSVPWSGVSGKPSTYTPSSHTHDDRYYTESEVDSKLNGKASSSHTHTKSQITDFPSSMKNPNSLTISLNGTSQGAYDGSAAKSINVTPSSIGAATSGHTHNYAGSSSAGGAATKANGIVVSDTRNDNSAPNDAAFDKNMLTADFKYGSKIGSPTGFNGTYCGVLSLAPWSEASGGHGYQLAFGYEKEGHPRLALRGSDLSATSWNSWYKVYTSDDKPTLSELGAAAASHSHTKSQITDFAHTHDDRYYTESEIDTKLSGKAASSHKHAAADITSVNASAITGTIAAANLPSYVDDVLEYAGTSKFPSTGEAGKIYTDTTTNKIYRWGGSSYVVISDTIALGETNSTAYRGDRGKTAYNHSQITSGNPHKVTKSDVGLGSVDNTSDANKSVKYAKSATANNPIKTTGTGAAYAAIVDGITALTIGVKFTMVPHVTSTTRAPTLNVNSLGAKNIRMRLTSSTTATIQLTSASFLTANKPVNVTYDGTYWVIDDFAQPDVNSLYGTVPISKGGTGATTAAKALANLGAMPKAKSLTASEFSALATKDADTLYIITDDTEEEKVQAHIANTTIHITAAERTKWNAKADITIGTAEPTSSTSGIFYIQTN